MIGYKFNKFVHIFILFSLDNSGKPYLIAKIGDSTKLILNNSKNNHLHSKLSFYVKKYDILKTKKILIKQR